MQSSGELSGVITIGGAKNSVLKLMAATLLAPGRYRISRVPRIADVDLMSELLRTLGCQVTWDAPSTLRITVPDEINGVAPHEIVNEFRASIAVLSPLLARRGDAKVALPGGDKLGDRPIGMHTDALIQLGATIATDDPNYVTASAPSLTAADISFSHCSVGATETALMAAVAAKGTTTIKTAACEPEIEDLCLFLTAMGAEITGIGTHNLTITSPGGTAHLSAVDFEPIPDRIEAGTYMIAVGIAAGSVTLLNTRMDHMTELGNLLTSMGMSIAPTPDGIQVSRDAPLRSLGDYETSPYPGLATDYQPLLVALLASAGLQATVTENVFASRFQYVPELQKMGANLDVNDNQLRIGECAQLVGTTVTAPDIRAGAALVLVGLAASGTTIVNNAHHVARGYEDLSATLASLNANVKSDP